MAFGKLSEWVPSLTHVDPRPSEKWSVGSKYCVIAVTKHPTFAQLRQNRGSIADARMVGLIQSFAAPQARPIFRLFEMGSRYPYTVPGKFMGTVALTSMMFDSGANLLGGIYEEVFTDPNHQLTETGRQILNTPKLYDPDLDPSGNSIQYDMSMVGAAISPNSRSDTKDWGAIRMSLDDNRMDVPFGLIFTIFQSSERIRNNFGTDVDPGGANLVANMTDDHHYRIMACLFFEMARVQSYDFQTTAEQEVLFESAQFYYHGLVNVKTSVEASVPALGAQGNRSGYSD